MSEKRKQEDAIDRLRKKAAELENRSQQLLAQCSDEVIKRTEKLRYALGELLENDYKTGGEMERAALRDLARANYSGKGKDARRLKACLDAFDWLDHEMAWEQEKQKQQQPQPAAPAAPVASGVEVK